MAEIVAKENLHSAISELVLDSVPPGNSLWYSSHPPPHHLFSANGSCAAAVEARTQISSPLSVKIEGEFKTTTDGAKLDSLYWVSRCRLSHEYTDQCEFESHDSA